MNISIYTNAIPGGWSPTSKFLKGSEECIKLFAESLVDDFKHNVTVFTDLEEDSILSHKKTKDYYNINGVSYGPRDLVFDPQADIAIIWKDREIDLGNFANETKVIKWSSDVEDHYDIKHIDAWVNLTKYHSDSNAWVPKEIETTIPHGIDINYLNKNKADKEENTMLYCSSPDRGLFNLLQDWRQIKENYPELKLTVTYGTEEIRKFAGNDAHNRFLGSMQPLIEQEDIEYLGCVPSHDMAKLYWKSQYWCLPLQKPQSELFCLNAVKAQYCDCEPVVNWIGALRDTVYQFHDYNYFIKKENDSGCKSPKPNFPQWHEVIENYWQPLFERLHG